MGEETQFLPVTIQQVEGNTWYTVASSTAGELRFTCPQATHDGSLALFRVEQDHTKTTLAACGDFEPG